MFGKTNWADVEDDVPAPQAAAVAGKTAGRWAEMEDDDIVAPSSGIGKVMTSQDPHNPSLKYKTEYLERDGKAIKKTTTIKTTTVVRKSNRFVEARKQWKSFGKSHDMSDPEVEMNYGKNTPVRDEQEIFLEINREKKMKTAGEEEKFWEQSITLMESVVNESSKKKWDAGALRQQREVEEQLRAAEAAGGPQGSVRRPDGAYVPPSMRKGDGKGGDDDRSKENTLRVLNLSEDAKEGDLHVLFQPFGKLNRVFLAKHRDGDKAGQSKGFAFVTFYERRDAERAMAKLNGHGYDSLILQVTWAKPKEN